MSLAVGVAISPIPVFAVLASLTVPVPVLAFLLLVFGAVLLGKGIDGLTS